MRSMPARVQFRLQQLNRAFYRRFGQAYAEKRWRLQPGVARVLERVPLDARVLDAGCGHGLVLHGLAQRGFRGTYVGLEQSPGLLALARRHAPPGLRAQFIPVDLNTPTWPPEVQGPFDVLLAFAVLHHIPGRAARRAVLRRLRARAARQGWLAVSVWLFWNSARMRARRLPWSTVGLTPQQVEPGDMLLDWRHGGQGVRYVHLYTPTTLADDLRAAGWRPHTLFLSDGEGGRLGLYALARPE